jgi:hypothetical protein
MLSGICPVLVWAFFITDVDRDQSEWAVTYESGTNHYFIADFGASHTGFTTSTDMELGRAGDGRLTDGGLHASGSNGFMAVRRVPLTAPGDTDQDGVDDVYELGRSILDPLNASDASQDPDNDGFSTLAEYQAGTDPEDGNDFPTTTSCVLGLPLNGMIGGDLGPVQAGPFEEIACLEIRNDRGVEREEVAFSGIPLSRDLHVLDMDNLVLVGPGERRLAAQFNVLSRWGGPLDNAALPVRWLEVSVSARVAPNATSVYALRRYPAQVSANDVFEAAITPQGNLFRIDTGLASFLLDPAHPALFQQIDIDSDDDGQGLTTVYQHTPGAGPRLTFRSAGQPITLGTANVGDVVVDPNGFQIVESGPVKVVVSMKGHFSDPGGASLCSAGGGAYERFGYTLVATFHRASRDVMLQFNVRNECSDAWSGPWTDQAVTIEEASWNFPFTTLSQPATLYAGQGGVQGTAAGSVLVEQRKGGGTPWRRRARVRLDGVQTESAECFESPLVGVGDDTITAVGQLAWMRYREPQAISVENQTISFLVISEPLVVGEGKGIWNVARLSILPSPASVTPVEAMREAARLSLERGLLVRAPLDHFNGATLFPSLGTGATSAIKSAYVNTLNQLHDETVLPGQQWDRAKTFGSQLWPDVQSDLWLIDHATPYDNNGAMNYWGPAGVELWEFLRTGDPKWVWDFALPQMWLQLFTAYLNIGDQDHGNRAGLAVNSGGTGEGQWHRSAYGSDDYTYCMGFQLGYAVRPHPMVRDRFEQAGNTVINRYDIPQANQGAREQWVSQVDLTRQVIQHFEMLANCAEFVPGSIGNGGHSKLVEIVTELAQDNLSAGVMCAGDVPAGTTCWTPQQFMQNALMYNFLHRYYRNYGDAAGNLRRALIEIPLRLYEHGLQKQADGVSLVANGNWAAGMRYTLSQDRTQVLAGTPAQDSDGNFFMYNPTRPHTAALLLMAHELDPTTGLCAIVKATYDDPVHTAGWSEFMGNGSGWWKGSAQMMQNMVFGVGLYDICE